MYSTFYLSRTFLEEQGVFEGIFAQRDHYKVWNMYYFQASIMAVHVHVHITTGTILVLANMNYKNTIKIHTCINVKYK